MNVDLIERTLHGVYMDHPDSRLSTEMLHDMAKAIAALEAGRSGEAGIPPEAVKIEDPGNGFMPFTAKGDWAIPNNCGARIVDERMAYGWNQCREEMLELLAAAPQQPPPVGDALRELVEAVEREEAEGHDCRLREGEELLARLSHGWLILRDRLGYLIARDAGGNDVIKSYRGNDEAEFLAAVAAAPQQPTDDTVPNAEEGDFDCPKAAASRGCACGFCIALRRPQQPPPADVNDEARRLIAAIQSMRDRMMVALAPQFGEAFDGDFDTMKEAANFLKRYGQPPPVGEPRFFIDHGMVHDRQTGKHVGDDAESLLALLHRLEQERDAWRYTAKAVTVTEEMAAAALSAPPVGVTDAVRDVYGKVIRLLASLVTMPVPDELAEREALPRDRVMETVMRIREAMDVEWRWVDEKGRAMTEWKAGNPPPMAAVADEKGVMRVEVRPFGQQQEDKKVRQARAAARYAAQPGD